MLVHLAPSFPNSSCVTKLEFRHEVEPANNVPMSAVQEIQAAIMDLSRHEIESLLSWIDDYLEDPLELSDEVQAKLDQSRRKIAEGHCTTRVSLHARSISGTR